LVAASTSALAKSSQKSGCCWASPSTSGSTGKARESFAIRLSSRSSSPNTGAGLKMVASGKAARTFSSPTAFERAHAEGEEAEAPSADTCTSRSTPCSAQIVPSTEGKVECTSWNFQRLVSKCLPSKLITMLEPATASSI